MVEGEVIFTSRFGGGGCSAVAALAKVRGVVGNSLVLLRFNGYFIACGAAFTCVAYRIAGSGEVSIEIKLSRCSSLNTGRYCGIGSKQVGDVVLSVRL